MNLEQYIPLLHKIANKFDEKYREDLVNEGYLELYEIQNKYDPDQGSFETFAYSYVYFRMLHYVENEQHYTSLDDTIEDEDGNYTTYADLIESEEDLQRDIENTDYYQKNLENSSKVERFIKERYYKHNMTPQQIVELYSEYTLIRDVRKIRQIIKK